MSNVRVIHGDSREVLKTFADASIDSVVCDPPYALVSIGKRFGADDAAACKVGATGAYARAAAGFMGKKWDTGETAFDPAFWAEVLRVLKPGGHLIAFGGTRSFHHLATAIERAGFAGIGPGAEIRDTISNYITSETFAGRFFNSLSEEQTRAFLLMMDEGEFGGMAGWNYGSGFPKSHDVSKGIDKCAGAEREVIRERYTAKRIKPGATVVREGAYGKQDINFTATDTAPATAAAWQGWGTALKPAMEPIVLARKPLDGTVAANVLAHGTGALNIDGCRIASEAGDPNARAAKQGAVGPGYEGGFGVTERSWDAHRGRWPANVIHDGSDEVLAAFPTAPGQQRAVTGEERSHRAVNAYGDFGASRHGAEPRGDIGSASRFFYSAKADAADRLGSKHPTVKPVDLMAYLCRLVTPPGGTVLDPFAGSGTTGMACLREGFNAILVEREAEYVVDIKRRLKHVSGEDSPLFDLGAPSP